jgi:phosphoribosylanthranilate isomerase|tara:strand:- start:1228 stop:1914 length:687 start_codon:yes stop_codon:yes gene_type:complete
MKIKVCGMRQAQNLKDLTALNPDYIGFIFYDKSKRFVAEFPQVCIDKSIQKVGVFVNETIETVIGIVKKHQLNAVQLHGDESVGYCEELKRIVAGKRSLSGVETSRSESNVIVTPLNHQLEIIKAFSVNEHFDFSVTKAYEPFCDLFLFDTKGKEYGGNGVKYDWRILENYKGEILFLLSGGISAADADAIKEFGHNKCIGLDLNSGFEDVPGVKNIGKLKTFFKEVK